MAWLKMTFGKYKGKRIGKIPSDYLLWCLESCDKLTEDLRQAIQEELATREDVPEKEKVKVSVGIANPLGERLVGDVRLMFRQLALKYHPDRGGSDNAMQALNDFHEQIQELLLRTFNNS